MKRLPFIFAFLLGTMLLYAQRDNGQIHVKGESFSVQDNRLHVDLSIDARSLRIPSVDALILIPELRGGGRSVELPRMVLNGKKRHKIFLREDALGITSYEGEIYSILRPDVTPALINYAVAIPYEGWMESASLYMRQETCGCPGEKKVLADGVLADNILGAPAPAPMQEPSEELSLHLNFMEPSREEIKARSEYGEAYLNFVVGKWDILYDYKDNARKLDQVQAFFREAQNDKNIVVEGITIIGYASPEGTYEFNMNLSQNRASSFANWVQSRFRFPANIYTVDWKGEDWEKLRTLVEDSRMAEKYQVLNIIDNYGVYEGRETKLMNLNGGRTYKQMLEFMFPQLRRVYYRIEYTVRPFSTQESKEIIKTKPQQLSVFEMYSAANTYRRGSKEYNSAMSKAAELFPQDPAANNNAAAVALQEGRLDDAKSLLDKTPESASKQNNLGVYYMLTGDLSHAAAAFNKALKGGVSDARHNLEILNKQLQVTRQREREEQERLRMERERQAEQLRIREAQRRAREEAERKQRMDELNKQKAVPYRIK